MALRRVSVALEHSVTVRERVLARDFSFNMGGGGEVFACLQNSEIAWKGYIHSEKEGQKDKQKMSEKM